VDLVGALVVSQLQHEAQGLRLRIDRALGHVPLAETGLLDHAGILGSLPPPID
jgi:hypothetical protein